MSWKTDKIGMYKNNISNKEWRRNICPKPNYKRHHKTLWLLWLHLFWLNLVLFSRNTTYTNRYHDSRLWGGVQTTGAHGATDSNWSNRIFPSPGTHIHTFAKCPLNHTTLLRSRKKKKIVLYDTWWESFIWLFLNSYLLIFLHYIKRDTHPAVKWGLEDV